MSQQSRQILRRILWPALAVGVVGAATVGAVVWWERESAAAGTESGDPDLAEAITDASARLRRAGARLARRPRSRVAGCVLPRGGHQRSAARRAAAGHEPAGSEPAVLLPGPTVETQAKLLESIPRPKGAHRRRPPAARYPRYAQATREKARIYARPGSHLAISYVPLGRVVRARLSKVDPPWYVVRGGGFVSPKLGFAVAKERSALPLPPRGAALDRPLPHRYGKVEKGALRYSKWPPPAGADRDEDEDEDEDDGEGDDGEGDEGEGTLPEDATRVTGAVFVAIQGEVDHAGETYLRLVDGTYIAAADVKRLDPPPIHGVRLTRENGLELPIAFVYREKTPLWRERGAGEAPKRCGEAVRHSRFRVVGERRVAGTDYVEAPGGVLVARDAVRVARESKRPYYVSSRTRWIHVDLSEQTLVAYLGTRPLLATLVSSGKKGRGTPPGHYRVEWKHVSVTMTGEDEKTGGYEVGEVPWTMYYRSLYALHGAYWHQQFGQVRSHGCINLPPADAYWLFQWTRPVRPAGWHSVRGKGTRLAITP